MPERVIIKIRVWADLEKCLDKKKRATIVSGYVSLKCSYNSQCH